jgi:hypothetical protein
MASCNEQHTPEVYEVRAFGAPYGDSPTHPDGGEAVGSADTQSGAAELAESLLHPGQHARIYDAAGVEVGRVYPGEGE